MTRVHLLTDTPTSQNSAAFLSPILWNRPLIRERGVEVAVFHATTANLLDCDVLAVSSKFWGGDWNQHREGALALLDRARNGRRIVYFDRSSSAGTVNADVLPLVHRYLKTSAYADRTNYRRAVYGSRLFADYYHATDGVTDESPTTSPVLSAADAQRIEVAWNTGLANYSLLGPRRWSLYGTVPSRWLASPPRWFTPPSTSRPIPVSCRMGLSYRHATVACQRRRMTEALAKYNRTTRVSKFAYVGELRRSRIVASPFGYSEINYKDFETFLNGALLFKPDMSHLDTWPNYFRPGETYVSHRWDLSDVAARIDEVLRDYGRHIEVAQRGQDLYRWHTSAPTGRDAFADRFVGFVAAQ